MTIRVAQSVPLLALIALLIAGPAVAQEPGLSVDDLSVALDTVWVLVAAALVFLMQAGFAAVECGFTRAKNAINIMTKNLVDFSLGAVSYWAIGFGLMFGAGTALVGTRGFFMVGDAYESLAWSSVPISAKFIFQMVFAATAATIVSGAVAERTKFSAYLTYSFVLTAIVYPISGHWIWGGGWLADLGMWDFAGSTVVHSVGGWFALVAAWLLGPRIGKYRADGTPRAVPGHNLPLATLGTFLLWFGWFGFNCGSTMGADAEAIAHIATTTTIAGASGALAAMVLSWSLYGKPDLGLSLNGALAGLVGITAGCAFVGPASAVIVGLLAGTAMLLAVGWFDRIGIDDPVGAISVHGVCGALGTICVGLFAREVYSADVGNGLLFGGGWGLLGAQTVGVVSVFIWSVAMAGLIFGTLKATVGLRVSREEELAGLDIGEHAGRAYAPEMFGPVGVGAPEAAEYANAAPQAAAHAGAMKSAE